MVAYKAIIGYRYIPIRLKLYYYDQYGRRKFNYVIRHKRKNVWGIKTKIVTKTVRVKSPDPGLLLLPNSLTFNASSMKEQSGKSLFVRDKGQPYQLTVQALQTGAISGPLSGDSTYIGPSFDPFVSVPNIDSKLADLKRQALSRLYSRVQDEKANLALMAAEGAKTIDLISDLFFSGLKLAKSLYRLQLNDTIKVVGASRQQLSSRWLQYVYGCAPLISEVNKIISDTKGSVKSWRKYSTRSSDVLTFSSSTNPPITGVSYSYNVTFGCKTSVIVDTSFSIPKASVAYGFSQPAAIAWELVPFSFVVDWFFPLGNWLTSSHALDTNIISYYDTYFVKTEIEYSSYHFINVPTGLQGGGQGPSGKKTQVYVSRRVGSAPPMPLPSISRSPLSPARVFNALALLNQRF
jgi:hypothetical protein